MLGCGYGWRLGLFETGPTSRSDCVGRFMGVLSSKIPAAFRYAFGVWILREVVSLA